MRPIAIKKIGSKGKKAQISLKDYKRNEKIRNIAKIKVTREKLDE